MAERRTFGIIGAGGYMGGDIVTLLAFHGNYRVLMVDTNRELIERRIGEVNPQPDRNTIMSNVKSLLRDRLYAEAEARGEKFDPASLTDDMVVKEQERVKALLTPVTNYEAFRGNGDLKCVIEAAFERIPVKKEIFQQLGQICPEEAILASNSSAIGPSIYGEVLDEGRRGRSLGIHFFGPAVHRRMKLVEVVLSPDTQREVVEEVTAFVKEIGKTPRVCEDYPGFIANRGQFPYLKEMIEMVQTGAASIVDADAALVEGYGLPMGPLSLMDLVGLGTMMDLCEVFRDYYGDIHAQPPLLRYMVEKLKVNGMRPNRGAGLKGGEGFFIYGENSKEPNPAVERFIEANREALKERWHVLKDRVKAMSFDTGLEGRINYDV